MFEAIPSLTVLDRYNRLGEEVESEEDEDYGAEGGEDDMDNEFISN